MRGFPCVELGTSTIKYINGALPTRLGGIIPAFPSYTLAFRSSNGFTRLYRALSPAGLRCTPMVVSQKATMPFTSTDRPPRPLFLSPTTTDHAGSLRRSTRARPSILYWGASFVEKAPPVRQSFLVCRGTYSMESSSTLYLCWP